MVEQIEKKYTDVSEIKCPICGGNINNKWFNFRSGDIIEMIAECWTPDNPDAPRHIFRFQLTSPHILEDDN